MPPTVNQRVPSVRTPRSKAAFLPCAALPSTAVPPRLLLHFHRTVDPPIPPQPKQQQIVANLFLDYKLCNGLMGANPGYQIADKNPPKGTQTCENLLKVTTNHTDHLATVCTLL